MTVRIKYYKPYRGWSNELTYIIFEESSESLSFMQEYQKSQHLLSTPKDLMLFCRHHLKGRFRLPATVWQGACSKVDWDQLQESWDGKFIDSVRAPRKRPKRARASTAANYLEERILTLTNHEGPVFFSRPESPSADYVDSYCVGGCEGIDIVFWCPMLKLAAVRVEDAMTSPGFKLANKALAKFSSSNRVSPLKGVPVCRVRVEQETEEGKALGATDNFLQVFLDDGSYQSRTYFAKAECDTVYELCLNSPKTVAEELSR